MKEKRKAREDELTAKRLAKLDELKMKHEEEKELRLKRKEEWQEFEKEYKKTKPLYKKLEEEYDDNVESELKKRKEEIQNIRDFHKPIRRDEFEEHERTYEENYRLKIDEKRIKREQWYGKIGYGVYDPSKFSSKHMQEVLRKEQMEKIKAERKKDEKHKKNEKMNQYAKLV